MYLIHVSIYDLVAYLLFTTFFYTKTDKSHQTLIIYNQCIFSNNVSLHMMFHAYTINIISLMYHTIN